MVLKKNENIFIAESQSLNIDETVRSNIINPNYGLERSEKRLKSG